MGGQAVTTGKNALRERRHHRLWFGNSVADRWSIPDPVDPRLEEAMHRCRYERERLTEADLWLLLAAAEAYQHLATYPLAGCAAGQLRAVRRAVGT